MAEGILNPVAQLEAEFDFEVYTKQEVDALLDEKADKSDTYTKTETDALLNDKADADAVYTKTETDTLLSVKADKSTTLAGYGITDAYTKTQTDNLLNGKADADSVYTKSEIDTKIPNTVGSATKPTYVNGGVVSACTYELKKTVPANAVFTDTTYSAGNGLNLSGTSFSAKAGTNVTVDGNGINVNGNGAVASADSGLLSGGTAYTELRPTLDGTWVKNAQTTGVNLQKLEGGIEYLYALLSKQYDKLKKYINGNYYDYDTDTDSKYVKTVPQGAMPYASLDSIGGKTLVWNQILKNGNFVDSTGWTAVNCSLSVADNVATITFDGSNVIVYIACGTITETFNLSHKYFLCGDFLVSGSASAQVFMYGIGKSTDSLNYPATQSSAFIHQARIANGSSGTDYRFRIQINTNSVAGTVQVKNAFICDLTLCYGAGNEPSTVQEFTAQFPAQYYSYNAGTLLSAGVTEVESVGKNLWNSANLSSNANYTVNADGSVTISASNYSVNTATTLKTICPNVQAGKTYKINGFGASSSAQLIYLLNGIGSWTFGVSKTLTENDLNATVLIYGAQSSASDYAQSHTIFFDLVEGQTSPTSHTPYKAPITYPIPAEIRALEGYGWSAGQVYNYIDYERKVFVKNVASVDLGTLTWTKYPSTYRIFTNGISTLVKSAEATNVANLICSAFTTTYLNDIMNNHATGIAVGSTGSVSVGIGSNDDTALDNLIASLNGVMLYYELATPQEIDISAYLTDDNLISVESGGTLTFPNSNGTDYQIPVPSSETYMVDLQSALGE